MSNKKKTLGILTTLVSLFSLTSCNTEMIQDRIETTVNNMLPNLWITLLQLGLFILVAILFIVIAYKPLKKKLNERADYIEKNIKDSEAKALEAEEKIKEANRIVLNGQKKAGEIIQRAEKTAENKASELEKQYRINIDKKAFEIPQIKTLGTFEAIIKLGHGLHTTLKLQVVSQDS